MAFDAAFTSLVIRAVHVVAMAILVGGAALLWGALSTPAASERERAAQLLPVAEAYEWMAWAATGLLVMTGVGNLGAFGEALPRAGSEWGGLLFVKLAAVLLFLSLSLVRTLLVARLRAPGVPPLAPRGRRVLRAAYGATALAAGGIVAVALLLAHGG